MLFIYVCAHLPCNSSAWGFIGATVSLMYSIQVVHYCTHVSDVCVLHGSVNPQSHCSSFPMTTVSHIFLRLTHRHMHAQSKCGNNVSVSFFRVNQEAEQSDNFVQQVSSSYTVLWSRLMYKFVSLCVFNGCEYILTFLHSFRWHAHEKGAHSKKNVFI